MTTKTTFGVVERDENGATHIYGSNLIGKDKVSGFGSLVHWSTYVGWPCSELARVADIAVAFDAKGDLVDISTDSDDIPADELNAWTSECLVRAGYPNHPAIR